MRTFLVTQMFPVAILIVPIYIIMANLGLINTLASLVIAYLHGRRAVLRLDAARATSTPSHVSWTRRPPSTAADRSPPSGG